MHFSTKSLTRAAIIAAAYCALSLVSSALSLAYGPVQLRFSEALCVLPFLMPEAVWGLFVGCLLTNVLSPYGLLDLIFGSAATLLAALLSARCKTRVGAAVPRSSAMPCSWARCSPGRWAARPSRSARCLSTTPPPSAQAKPRSVSCWDCRC